MDYPVTVTVIEPAASRNRLTIAVRPLLAIPHIVLVGPIYWSRHISVGLLGAAAYVMAIFAWFLILIRGTHPAGVRDFALYYLRWRTRALAYMALLTDEYPPLGDGPYPATIDVLPLPANARHTVRWRLFAVLPHIVVLIVLLVGWFATTVIAWFAILVTGRYPAGLFSFGAAVMQWALRVEAYLLLLTDEYPPFELQRGMPRTLPQPPPT